MSTPLTVKTQMQSLLNLANETTGKSDVTLTDGVNSLVEGYGQGSSGVNVELYDITWETTNGVEVNFEYMGLDENNTLTPMATVGTSGSFRCIEGIYAIMAYEVYDDMFGEWVYPSIMSVTTSDDNYVESFYISPNDTIAVRINQFLSGKHLIIDIH